MLLLQVAATKETHSVRRHEAPDNLRDPVPFFSRHVRNPNLICLASSGSGSKLVCFRQFIQHLRALLSQIPCYHFCSCGSSTLRVLQQYVWAITLWALCFLNFTICSCGRRQSFLFFFPPRKIQWKKKSLPQNKLSAYLPLQATQLLLLLLPVFLY